MGKTKTRGCANMIKLSKYGFKHNTLPILLIFSIFVISACTTSLEPNLDPDKYQDYYEEKIKLIKEYTKEETDVTATFNEEENKYSFLLKDKPYFDITLITYTPNCISCSIEFKIKTYDKKISFAADDKKTRLDFIKIHPLQPDDFLTIQTNIRVSETKQIKRILSKSCEIIQPDGLNYTIESCNFQTDIIDDTKEVLQEIDLVDYTFEKEQEHTLVIKMDRKAVIGKYQTDFIPTIAGITLDRWVWFDTDFINKHSVNWSINALNSTALVLDINLKMWLNTSNMSLQADCDDVIGIDYSEITQRNHYIEQDDGDSIFGCQGVQLTTINVLTNYSNLTGDYAYYTNLVFLSSAAKDIFLS